MKAKILFLAVFFILVGEKSFVIGSLVIEVQDIKEI